MWKIQSQNWAEWLFLFCSQRQLRVVTLVRSLWTLDIITSPSFSAAASPLHWKLMVPPLLLLQCSLTCQRNFSIAESAMQIADVWKVQTKGDTQKCPFHLYGFTPLWNVLLCKGSWISVADIWIFNFDFLRGCPIQPVQVSTVMILMKKNTFFLNSTSLYFNGSSFIIPLNLLHHIGHWIYLFLHSYCNF